MGHLATAIRVEYLGFPVKRAIHTKYLIAAALSGAGGAGWRSGIDPDMTYWTNSGEFAFIAILAGAGSVLAPW
jgi:branched-chain amino acid transport system permease protein